MTSQIGGEIGVILLPKQLQDCRYVIKHWKQPTACPVQWQRICIMDVSGFPVWGPS